MNNVDKTMNENETEVINSTNDTEETVNPEETTDESGVNSDESEDTEFLKKKIATLEAQKNHWKQKATKPETKVTEKKETVAKSNDSLPIEDTIALHRSNIHEDDISEVLRYAKFQGISVREALKSNVVKSLLATKEESRRVAEATNTGASRRTSAKSSEESLLSKAEKGELPSSDEDIKRLAEARFLSKKKV